MTKNLPLAILLFTISLDPSCTQPQHRVTPAFYHWRSGFEPGVDEQAYLAEMGVDRLYLRFFDVDWSEERGEAVPVGSMVFKGPLPEGVEVVPTVFITNRAVEQADVSVLADKLIQKIERMLDMLPEDTRIPEWQLDCDWTETTRDAFFKLVSLVQGYLDKQGKLLSVTIRLHQVKYADRTGVPPADLGMLMFYNTGDIQDPAEANSILDIGEAARYIDRLDRYELPLDLALPLFSWGAVYRDGKLVRLISGLQAADLQDTNRFRQEDGNSWTILTSTYLDGYYLYRDDRIRLEEVSLEELRKAARILQPRLSPIDRHVAFFELNPNVIKRYPYDSLQAVVDLLRAP